MTSSPSYELAPLNEFDRSSCVESLEESSVSLHRPKSNMNHPSSHSRSQRVILLHFLLKKTGFWVAGGLTIMLVGTAIIQLALLPHIYICPAGATCSHSIDPNTGVLQRLQTLMTYWLHIGIIISGYGLFRLMAYQSWFSMKHRGTTIHTLQNNLGALQGSAFSAVLLLRKCDRSLAAFTLVQIAITAAISLIVGYSISPVTTPHRAWAEFNYPTNFTITSLGPDYVWQRTRNQLESWIFEPDNTPRQLDAFKGTLVVRDNRTTYGIDVQPTGNHILGDIACAGDSIQSVVFVSSVTTSEFGNPGTNYNITLRIPAGNETESTVMFLFSSVSPLSLLPLASDDLFTLFLWATNISIMLLNATAWSDGQLYLTVCNHSFSFPESQQSDAPGTQYLESTSLLPLLLPGDPVYNMIAQANSYVPYWWTSGITTQATSMRCLDGFLTPFAGISTMEHCQVNATTWNSTVVALFDAMVETVNKTGTGTQRLLIETNSISGRRWWLQGVIPLATLVLYGACLGYTLYLNREHATLKELNLFEIAEEIYNLAGVRHEALNPSTTVGGMSKKEET